MMSLAAMVIADVNASIGVLAVVGGIILLIVVLVAVSFLEAAGEHAEDREEWRRHHA